MPGEAARSGGKGRLPTFLIIGAQKSGTSALARHLGAHPEVFFAPRKELRFFHLNYGEGLDWYQEWFAGATSERALGEGTPYLSHREAICRMGWDLPHVRLIAVLRNPIDRAYSQYWMRRSRRKTSLEFGEEIGTHPEYVERGRYLGQLRNVCEAYPRESLLVQIFETAIADPANRYREVCQFLELDDRFIPDNLGDKIGAYTTLRSRRIRRMSKRWLGEDAGSVKRTAGNAIAELSRIPNASYPLWPMRSGRSWRSGSPRTTRRLPCG